MTVDAEKGESERVTVGHGQTHDQQLRRTSSPPLSLSCLTVSIPLLTRPIRKTKKPDPPKWPGHGCRAVLAG
jgi:hypothetical protein